MSIPPPAASLKTNHPGGGDGENNSKRGKDDHDGKNMSEDGAAATEGRNDNGGRDSDNSTGGGDGRDSDEGKNNDPNYPESGRVVCISGPFPASQSDKFPLAQND
jgi:hypothetical protein